MIMKHYLVLCYENRTDQAPSKKVVIHEDSLSHLGSFFESYAYVVVEPLDLFV